ncbi:lipoyl(octanoyl) transferase [Sinobacterium caligoides]|uniref:Octanoyltransferase n=1 Tax=Sinobacterium caligoides TaxID=933926 RepID=A0A3N2DNI1_9GAMM|nr:lipoyl(octanoyl) transferase LipB [Sinobacterium caligoides]ROS01364.1 lipoyl(octanoyl) transferase [Sinobacterium caligoides]
MVRTPGLVDYNSTFAAMQQFTERRDANSLDELWVLQHQPVFTQGRAGKPEHLLATGDIPVVQADRGGQVTYHGPGQLVIYLLIDIKRLAMNVRELVDLIEQSIVSTLAGFGIAAAPKADAPGVYVQGDKIASLGLRIRRGCSFHGLALNIDNDLSPFQRINPCGYAGMKMTSVSAILEEAPADLFARVEQQMIEELSQRLGYPQRCTEKTLPSQ